VNPAPPQPTPRGPNGAPQPHPQAKAIQDAIAKAFSDPEKMKAFLEAADQAGPECKDCGQKGIHQCPWPGIKARRDGSWCTVFFNTVQRPDTQNAEGGAIAHAKKLADEALQVAIDAGHL
jgi:hypothetical protein